VDQQISVSNALRNRCHDGIELPCRDGARVGDRDMSVADPACLARNFVGAERNDGGNAERVLGCKLCRIFEAAKIQPFPDSSHAHNSSSSALFSRGSASELVEATVAHCGRVQVGGRGFSVVEKNIVITLPVSRLAFQVPGAVAEFEREMLREKGGSANGTGEAIWETHPL
jgi:hypothetical protein